MQRVRKTDMAHPVPPSDLDPAQLPVQPEFPTDHDAPGPDPEAGEPGADENAAGFVKHRV